MKRSLLCLWVLLPAVAPAAVVEMPTGKDEVTVVERGKHHRVIQRVSKATLGDGSVVDITNRYTEIGTGLCYNKDGVWMDSVPRFQLFPGGAVAAEGPFQLILAPDVAQEGAVDLLTPDGKRFISSPRWLAFRNVVTGESTIIAVVKSCAGQWVQDGVILFDDAFDSLRAAIRYSYKPDGIEQEVIFLENAPLNPAEWGLQANPADLVVEMWTEFHQAPQVEKATATTEPDGLGDVTLEFGEARLGTGKAFFAGDGEDSVFVGKTWTMVEQRQFLIEAVRQTDLTRLLTKIPQGAQAHNPAQAVRRLAQRKTVPNRKALLALGSDRLRARERRRESASIQRARILTEPGVILDYSIVTTTSGFRFEGSKTYYVTNSITQWRNNV